MKNLILGLLLVVSLQSFAQGKFRGTSWGTTSSELKVKYPDAQWESHSETNTKILTTEGFVDGLEVNIVYYYINDKLIGGGYYFSENHRSDNMYYDEFISISNTLNKKYEMEITENWNNTSYENSPNQIGFALNMGHVEIEERFEDELTSITHSISSNNNNNKGGIEHTLFYRDIEYLKKKRASEVEDF